MFSKRKRQSKGLGDKNYEQLGRQIVDLYDELKPNRAALYRTNFLKGMVSGLGGIIGATVGIAVLLWLLSRLGHIPIIGPFVDTVKSTLQKHPK